MEQPTKTVSTANRFAFNLCNLCNDYALAEFCSACIECIMRDYPDDHIEKQKYVDIITRMQSGGATQVNPGNRRREQKKRKLVIDTKHEVIQCFIDI